MPHNQGNEKQSSQQNLTVDDPAELPIVQRCVNIVKERGNMDQAQAESVCVRRLRQAGRIRQTEQGFVQVQQGQQRRQDRSRQQARQQVQQPTA